MVKLVDITGVTFGRWKVLDRAENNHRGLAMWLCICECGTERVVAGANLRNGISKSCGCLNKDILRDIKATHGQTRGGKDTPEYKAWNHMMGRCYNTNNQDYSYYGGRGIKVEWKSFEQFYEDMGKRPSSKHSIERLDVNANYTKENCIWANKTQQARNQRIRKDNKTGVKGVKWNQRLNKYEVGIRVNKKQIYLGLFITLEEAAEARKQAELKYWGKSS